VGLFAGTPWDVPPRCERCGELEKVCQCPPPEAPARVWTSPSKQTARLSVEKRSGGKIVTLVRGLAAEDNDLPALVARLKTACGAGGTAKDETIEIQGRHLERVRALLEEIGYKTRG
jgi:translation initiation factor 1